MFLIGKVKVAHAAIFVPLAIGAGIVTLLKMVTGMNIIGAFTSAAIYYVAYALAYLMGFIASAVFYLGGLLVNFALKINLELLRSPIIETGWKIILAFTNLGFVLGIIVIALATIFRLESYALKQTLWKLIVAALLVNFSLVVAGAFIDVANNLTQYFSDRIGGETGLHSLSIKLAQILNVQGMLSLEEFQSYFPSSATSTPGTLPITP